MRTRDSSTVLCIGIFAVGLMFGPGGWTSDGFAQPPSARSNELAGASIVAEAARLKKTLAALKLPAEENGSFARLIDRIDRASQAGRLFLSLLLLQQAATALPAREYLGAKKEVEKGGLEAFEREWKRLGEELAEKESRLRAGANRRTPLAVRAILERS